MSVGVHGLEFVAIEEVGGGAAFAEEEPVASCRSEGAALMQERPEGGDAGAGADHDDGRVGVGGETEFLVGLDVDGQRSPVPVRSAKRVEQTPPRSRLCER